MLESPVTINGTTALHGNKPSSDGGVVARKERVGFVAAFRVQQLVAIAHWYHRP